MHTRSLLRGTSPARDWRTRRPGRAVAAAVLAAALSASLSVAGPASAATPTAPPPVTVLTPGADNANGDIFIAPFGDTGSYANGPEILSPGGRVIWFHAVPAGAGGGRLPGRPPGPTRADLVAGYRPRPPVERFDYVYSARYQKIAKVKAGNGYHTAAHEFLITPQSTALVLPYTKATANLAAIGGPRRPDRDRRDRAGDRHPHRPGAVPVEQRRSRAVRGERAAAAGLGEPPWDWSTSTP